MKLKWVHISMIVAVVAAQVWCSNVNFRYPYIGIYLKPTAQQEWLVDEVDQESLSRVFDLQVGDKVTLVNGLPPEQYNPALQWHALEQMQQFTVIHNEQPRQIEVQNNSAVTFDLLPLFQELVWMLMAVLLYVKMGGSQAARKLALVFATGGIIWMSYGASVRGDATGKILITTFMMLLPVVFTHFLIVFFREKAKVALSSKALKYAYGFVVLSTLPKILYYYPPTAYAVYQSSTMITLTFFCLGFVVDIFLLAYVYVKYRKSNSYISSVIRSILTVLSISIIPMIVFSFVPQLINNNNITPAFYLNVLGLLFPMYFAYLLSSNQIFNIGLVLRRFAFATIVAVVPSAVLAAIYAFVFQSEDNLRHLLFIFFGGVFLISLILYSIEYVTTRLEGFFFPKKFLLNAALKNIAKKLGAISSFRELKELVLIDIVETLETVGGAIIFKYNDGMREIIQAGDMDESGLQDPPGSLAGHPLYSCFEIHHHEEYRSFLVLGPKKTNALLGKEERQWLQLIISYLAVSLENLHLIRKQAAKLKELSAQLPDEQSAQDIQWFRKLMFELQEEERARIASDLHDTTMQDLFFLKQRFSSIADKYAWSTDDRRQIKSIINFVEMINVGLRQSCFDLHPYLLKECGLVQTVDLFVEKENVDSLFAIQFAAEHTDMIESLELSAKTHLFRIVQELLNNARKHSQATAVRLRLDVADCFCRLTYEDNGVGFAEPAADAPAEAAKGIRLSGQGLAQMKSRVLHVNGRFELSSQEGTGTKLSVCIPLKATGPVINPASAPGL